MEGKRKGMEMEWGNGGNGETERDLWWWESMGWDGELGRVRREWRLIDCFIEDWLCIKVIERSEGGVSWGEVLRDLRFLSQKRTQKPKQNWTLYVHQKAITERWGNWTHMKRKWRDEDEKREIGRGRGRKGWRRRKTAWQYTLLGREKKNNHMLRLKKKNMSSNILLLFLP